MEFLKFSQEKNGKKSVGSGLPKLSPMNSTSFSIPRAPGSLLTPTRRPRTMPGNARLPVGGVWRRAGKCCSVLAFRRGGAAYWRDFSLGTVIVNVTGSFVIGLFWTLTAPEGRWLVPPWFRQPFFMYGICGGYTTFSSFSLQTLTLAEDGQWLYAGANVFISVVSCLLAVWLGHLLATTLNATPR